MASQNSKDFDSKYSWRIEIPVGGWPNGVNRAFKIKSQYDAWLVENDIDGDSYYNFLYLQNEMDVIYFKLSWIYNQNYRAIKLR
jgi:hypothetical protein|tara:strand:+ start:24 stop:275 length:252 start_codon:yes stop_codon:yes gene_type:complete